MELIIITLIIAIVTLLYILIKYSNNIVENELRRQELKLKCAYVISENYKKREREIER